ncbi:reverse transcriptase domain-containing protein [Tanacetum coccineum]
MFPPLGDEDETEGPMIIEAEIGGHFIHRIYVDGGSASEILYEHCFNRLHPEVKTQMVPATALLIGFSREIIWPMGQILLPVKIGDAEHFTSTWMNFMIVRSSSPYNRIIGRPGVRKIQSVPSTAHGMLKYPVPRGILTLRSSMIILLECTMVPGPEAQPSDIIQAAKERIKVDIHPKYPEQTIAIGFTLIEKGRKALCDLLRLSLYVFAWKPADMTGVPRYIAEHMLNVREGCSPVREKKRSQAPERNKAIQEEVEKLAPFLNVQMTSVHISSGLVLHQMTSDHNRSELGILVHSNETCQFNHKVVRLGINPMIQPEPEDLPKDNPKLEIAVLRYPFKCFLDAYKGYHQIKIAKEDEEKKRSLQAKGVFCYSKMPFGLKNAGATYQRLVDKAFQNQIGRNLEVYMEDLVIKSRTEHEIIKDMEETFKTLREINMKLNLKKCTFGIEEGMFLGYKVNTEGIMVRPDKVGAVLNLLSPKCLKDVQKLNEKLASLNRFLSKSAEKTPNVDCTNGEREELIVYLAAAREAESAVLMTKREAKQMPVYFVSHALQGPEINYTSMKKLILSRPKVVRRLQKWSIELGEYDIQYRPRTSVKGQILADFIVERPEDDPLDTSMEAEEDLPFDATNNEAEYEALIAGLRIAEQIGVKNLQTNLDSRLVANQVNGFYIAKEPAMIQYLEKVKTLSRSFKKFSIKQVPRSENKKADALRKIASTSFAHLTKQVWVEELKKKSINEAEVLEVVEEEGDTWMTPIYNYLTKEKLPAEKEKARVVRCKSGRYALINEILYKKSYLRPWLRCVGPLQANYFIREIHEGSCSMHARTRSMVAKAIRTGYYWSTMHADARKLIRACQDCQVYCPVPRNPQQKLTPSCPHGHYTNGEFTKWIEAKPVATITSNQIEELPHVLWAHRTIIKSSNGDTPFSLTYGTEAVILAKIGMPTMRTTEVDTVQNDEDLEINLDLLEEIREQAAISEAKSKEKMEKYYNSKVRNTSFKPRDLVYRSNEASHTKESGKLSPKWEGQYEVTKALGNRAYKLRDRNGKLLPRTWNVRNLKKCYVHEM